MQSIIELLNSEAMIAAHLAVTCCLLVFVLVAIVPLMGWKNVITQENTELRDELRESDDRRRRAEQRISDEQRRHRLLLSKIGDDIYDVRALVPEDFDMVRDINAANLNVVRSAEDDFEVLPQIMLPEQPGLDTQPTLEPFPEAITDITEQYGDLDGPLDDSINDESDPLTRALQISKAIRG